MAIKDDWPCGGIHARCGSVDMGLFEGHLFFATLFAMCRPMDRPYNLHSSARVIDMYRDGASSNQSHGNLLGELQKKSPTDVVEHWGV